MSLTLLGILNAQAAGGGGGAFDLLETTTLTSVTSNTNADMIPYWAPLNLEDSGAYMALVLDVLDFSSTTKATTARALWGNSTTNSKRVGLSSGGMFLTDAITTINCWSNGGGWVAGSRFSLYGIKGA
jgi:hypothetical protein